MMDRLRKLVRTATPIIAAVWMSCAQIATAATADDTPADLSLLSVDNENAAVATSEDGRRTAVAWDGYVDGQRRILLREQVGGLWLPEETIIDNEPTGDNQSPSVEIDSAGDYHIAWLSRVGGKLRVFYAFRKAGTHVLWGIVDGGEGPDDNCKAVAVRVDSRDRPWIVWQAGAGSSVSIRCAYLDAVSGRFVADLLTPQAESYNLYPELFFLPAPTVLWYADFDSDVILTGRQYNDPAGDWSLYVPENFDNVDSDRFPFLFKRSSGLLAALWPGQIEERDRILLGVQNPETQGIGYPIGSGSEGLNDFISGAMSGNEMVAVWRSWTIESGAQIYFAHGPQVPFSDEISVSNEVGGYNSRPRAAAVPGGAVVVWQSTASDGGDGQIYFRRVSF